MNTKETLELKARRIVSAVWNSPEGRLDLRKAFYRKYGHPLLAVRPGDLDPEPEVLEFGLGRSEIDFMAWEVRRGVLALNGSAWWRGVNGDFLYWGELAKLAFEAGQSALDWELPVRHWLDYLEKPGPTSWYRAHNTSIIEAYRTRVDEAHAEPESERVFVNIVLYRLLFAQALVEDVTPFGALGKLLADPRLPAVKFLVGLPDFYPDDYPLTDEDFADITGHGGFSPQEIAVRILDDLLLKPHIEDLYKAAASWNSLPELMTMQTSNKPTYPVGVAPLPSPNKKPRGKKQKIAILGGGVAALAAAWELTSYDGWENDYEITLYQLGWRCGGKAGTGRGANGRVEELGLHLLLGFYVNAFPMFQEAYAERTRRGLWPTARYKTLPDAIKPNWGALLVNYDSHDLAWHNWPMIFPPSPGYPGDGPPLSTWQLLRRGVAILLETILGSPYGDEIGPLARWLLDHFFPKDGGSARAGLLSEAANGLLGGVVSEIREKIGALDAEAGGILDDIERHALAAVAGVDDVLDHLHSLLRWLARKLGGGDRALLHLYWLLDFGIAMLTGILKDVWEPGTGKFNYRRINRLDFRAWLKSHGATETTLYSPMVTFFYTGTFEVLADGNDQGGALAAGTALQFAIPALGYKGSFMFQLRLGTADTLVMPMYQVLAARGVRFEFFCEVKNIPWTGARSIDRVELERQVDLVVPSYDPVVDVEGNPCWPSEPRYEQIDPAQARRLRDEKIDLESPWSGWKGKPFSIERGKDFDLLILGIPSKAQRYICAEIMANRPDWRAMVENIHTAQVMSAQLWFRPTLEGLGYVASEWGMNPENTAPNVVTYQNPMFSWLDQSQILPNESWPGDGPRMLAMYTGVLPNPPEVPPPGPSPFPEQQRERVKQLTWQWLMDNMGWFFPKATTKAYPKGVDLTLLEPVDPGAQTAMERYAQQWFVAAVAPTNQYVLAVPDTEQYRLQPGGSGFENLYLVGDWTDYGTNIGYMEGCVVSAKEAIECLREREFGLFEHRTFWRDSESDWSRRG